MSDLGAPYPGWHCVWIDEMIGEWVVSCIPHGVIARKATHLAAMQAALEHDPDNRSGHEQEL